MSTLQKFVRLTPSVQRRIIKVARQVSRMTLATIDFDYVVETMTETEWNRLQSTREYRREQLRRA